MDSYARLNAMLMGMGGVVIGYSGGVDSTLLAKAATDALGDKALCVMIESCLVPGAETDDALEIASTLGLNLKTVSVDVLSIINVPENSPDRCYYCKLALFKKLTEIAEENNLKWILDGTNADDTSDYRPGSRATAELGVRSPLKELGITKEQVRAISRNIGLPTWNKPSYACLASRIPYGTPLSVALLQQVENAESVLRSLDFQQFRVRHHGEVARIELMALDMEKIVSKATRMHIVKAFKDLGYTYVALDLDGYRTGSMNEVLSL